MRFRQLSRFVSDQLFFWINADLILLASTPAKPVADEGRLCGSLEPDDDLNFFPEMLASTWRNIPVFHGQVLETTTEDLTRKRKPQKEIPVFWLKIFVCCAVSTTGPTQANALLGAEKLVYGFQETVIP